MMLKGLLLLAVAFLLPIAMGETIGVSLVAVCITLILLPPSWDPAIIIKERQLKNASR
jgi:hypothetical protein